MDFDFIKAGYAITAAENMAISITDVVDNTLYYAEHGDADWYCIRVKVGYNPFIILIRPCANEEPIITCHAVAELHNLNDHKMWRLVGEINHLAIGVKL